MSTAVIGAPEFRARSGRRVRSNEDGSVTFEGVRGYLGPEQVFDAEEYFQLREDARRGRWRSPQHPDFVCYEHDGSVFVIDERDGRSVLMQRGYILPGLPEYSEVATAYFEVHPERKPWHDAKPEEVWVMSSGLHEFVAMVMSDGRFQFADGSFMHVSEEFVDGRRIFSPEDAS